MESAKKISLRVIICLLVQLDAGCSIVPENRDNTTPENTKAAEMRNVTPLDWNPMTVTYQRVDRSNSACHAIQECAQLITSVVYSNWRRPAVSLTAPASYVISLDGDNNVVGLKLNHSSGDFRYDKSAAVAIMSSSPFQELESLDLADRDHQFQTFEIIFRLEELN